MKAELVAEYLTALRLKNDLTFEAIAEISNRSVSTVKNLCTGKTEDPNKPKEENKMKKNRMKKFYILVTVYVLLIIIELFFYVPYHNIQIFKTNQNVPHTEIVGSGYATMADITADNAYIENNQRIGSGKIVNTSQIFMNVSITTVLGIAIYYFLQKNEKEEFKNE